MIAFLLLLSIPLLLSPLIYLLNYLSICTIFLSFFFLTFFTSHILIFSYSYSHTNRARQAKSKARQYQFYELVEKAKGRGPDQAKIQIATPEEKEKQKRLGGVVAEFKGWLVIISQIFILTCATSVLIS